LRQRIGLELVRRRHRHGCGRIAERARHLPLEQSGLSQPAHAQLSPVAAANRVHRRYSRRFAGLSISIGERLQKSLWRPEAPAGATDENGVSAFDELGGLDGGQDNRLALHGTSEPRIVAGYLLAQGAAPSIWAAREMREASAYGCPTS